MIQIDSKYKIPLVGIYNAGVYECPYCGHSVLEDFFKHICGFSEAYIGVVKITECPKCFKKYYSHASEGDYSLFISEVKNQTNVHFKEGGAQ
ncbi:MAG: hypothetical protein IKU25_00340 [Clostridia bacterium]|nr:hypothetical protein [Clostridia bacterium]